ncbi:response regulator transcription factor [Actinophytocola sp.]|jgi:two-component system nitrate/nitrite response regulator NarL|uniref:response regulator transcription factor n=1 Tax=Actinophytocola sp. TaxID=1872138 RepID=UPI002F92B86B
MTSVVIGDDRALLVESLTVALGHFDLVVAASGRDLTEVVAAAGRLDPDVCVLNRGLLDPAPRDGMAAVRAAAPRTGVVLLTEATYAAGTALGEQCRADGYVHMARRCADLVDTIRRVATGEVVDIEAWRRQANVPVQRANRRTLTDNLTDQLTDRERQCLALLVDGQRTELMAGRLGVSVTTVRSHVQALMHKLGVHSRLEAAAYAVRNARVTPCGGPDFPRSQRAAR